MSADDLLCMAPGRLLDLLGNREQACLAGNDLLDPIREFLPWGAAG
jgi:hypothetical protein